MKFTNWKFNNLLVHHVTLAAYKKILPQYIKGTVVDIGCGIKPYTFIISPHASKYIGIDPGAAGPDVRANAYHTALKNESADSVFSSAVMEHLEEPGQALDEIHRILKPGGAIVLGIPFFWHLHEKPRDFYRYTEYGIKYLLEKSGFEIALINPLSGFWITWGAQLTSYLATKNRKLIKLTMLVPLLCILIQILAWVINFFDKKSTDFSWAYVAVAHKGP